MNAPLLAKYRTAWTSEELVSLRTLLLDGLTCAEAGAVIGRTPSATNNIINDMGWQLNKDAAIRRGYIRRRWTEWPILDIARACKLSVVQIVKIGQSLGLSTADLVTASKPEPKARWQRRAHVRARWARRYRHVSREAALIWDMARVSQGLAPIGRGYA